MGLSSKKVGGHTVENRANPLSRFPVRRCSHREAARGKRANEFAAIGGPVR